VVVCAAHSHSSARGQRHSNDECQSAAFRRCALARTLTDQAASHYGKQGSS
jgi:hypothetical protein